MDPLWWITGLGVLAVIVVVSVRGVRARVQPPSEDPDAERAAHEQARLEHEKRGQIGPGEGSI